MLYFGREGADGILVGADQDMDRAFVRSITPGAFGAFTESPIKHIVVGRCVVGEEFSDGYGGALFCYFGCQTNKGPINMEKCIISHLPLREPCLKETWVVKMSMNTVFNIVGQGGIGQG